MNKFAKVIYVLVICAQVNVILCEVSIISLSSSKQVTWTLENKNGSIKVPGSVPGGVYSDLMKAGVIGDILKGFNDVLTRWVAYDQWTYTGTFNVSDNRLKSAVAHLVLHGVDTYALITLNGIKIGTPNNMFLRYVYDVKQYLKVGTNELVFKFYSPVVAAQILSDDNFVAPNCVPAEYHGECHVNQIRKMQASFGWDWGPAFPSVGIWKPAEIEFYNTAIIRTMVVKYEKKDNFWDLKITTYIESSMAGKNIDVRVQARLTLEGKQTVQVDKGFNVETSVDGHAEVDIHLHISENVVRLWWPNGYGDQPLYDLFVRVYTVGDHADQSQRHKKIGFRTVKVIQVPVAPKLPPIFANSSAGNGLTFYFEVNGYPLFMKGSNWIPQHILPEYSYEPHRTKYLLRAAAEVHMSMLRVWGGGLYESDYFYGVCDELGIMIWQDFPFACSMYPADPDFIETVKTEVKQKVIDLQSHPSIVIWAGNNENEAALRGNWYKTAQDFDRYKAEYIKLYVTSIKPIVESLVGNDSYLVSSPSNGVESEAQGYIAQNPYDPHYGDTHYYNYVADNWNENTYPPTRFASEYGFQSLPSLFTMRHAAEKAEDFSLGSEYSKHRQHSPNGYMFIQVQMDKRLNLDKNDTKFFEKFIFYSQISQAMIIKTQTEFYRQSRDYWYSMGALYWQLNDVWQAPSWSGIEYGGKWKMLHYFAKKFFAPVLVSPDLIAPGVVVVYLLNDLFVPITNATIVVNVYKWDSVIPIMTTQYEANAPALSSSRQPYEINIWQNDTESIFLKFSLKAANIVAPDNYLFPQPLTSITGLQKPEILILVSKPKKNGNEYDYVVVFRVNAIVLFLWFEADGVDGYFQDNGFIVTATLMQTHFRTKTHMTPEELKEMITYQYYYHGR